MTSESDLPAFEMRDLHGKHYRIWSDGRTEGFEDVEPRLIINRIPLLIAEAKRRTT